MSLSAAVPDKQFCTVNGYNMAYVEVGPSRVPVRGKAVKQTLLFLHGNPTSSYLWRNVMAPQLCGGRFQRSRCIAPDLIGMGDSDKLNNSGVNSYRFVDHVDFLDKLLDCINVEENVVLVIHDWGSALGFWWAYRYPERIKGIVYMEAFVQPLTFDFFAPEFVDFFEAMRTPGVGEELVLEQNIFIEETLPSAIIRNLTEEEMDAYRAPYLEPGEGRRPTLTWPREVPVDGEPEDVVEIVSTYSSWMATNNIPKLLISAQPGLLLVGEPLEFARTWKNQTEVTVPGLHFIQEDSPIEIAQAINEWMYSDAFVGSQGILSLLLAWVWRQFF